MIEFDTQGHADDMRHVFSLFWMRLALGVCKDFYVTVWAPSLNELLDRLSINGIKDIFDEAKRD